MAKIYNTLLLNCIQLEIEKILRKNQNSFQRNITTSQILTIYWIFKGVYEKNLEATLLFVDSSKAFDSIHRGKMEQILLSCDLPKETVTAVMMLYKNTKLKVHSLDGDTDFFDIVAGVLQERYISPKSVHNLPRLCTSNVDSSNERKWLYTKKDKKQMIPHTNYYRCKLHRWYRAFIKYTYPSWIPAALSGAGSR